MKIRIQSKRKLEDWPSFHLLYEWEDEMIKCIPNAKLKNETFIFKLLEKLVKRFPSMTKPYNLFTDKGKLYLGFELSAKLQQSFENRKNFIPVIIDFFHSENKLERFEQAHSKNPLVLISSKEVYDYLKDKLKRTKIVHWGLSLPDKYKIDGNEKFEKIYDFVLFGRQNKILLDYLKEYEKKYPNIIYVYESNEKFHYVNNLGEYVGYYKGREEYIQLMRTSKMALYSTPGMDNSRQDANGFNQVTPRFLGYIACGCQLVLRYPHNADTEYYHLGDFCPCINTFSEFERIVNTYRDTNPNMKFYAKYLSQHYTSVRVKELKKILSETYGKTIF